MRNEMSGSAVASPHLGTALRWWGDATRSLKSLWLVWLLALGTGFCAAQSAGKGEVPVGSWGEIARLEFHGLKAFAANDVVNALLQTPGFLLASHPAAPRREYARALEKFLGLGYQAAGFPEVTVAAILDEASQRVRVNIIEGPASIAVLCGWKMPGTSPWQRS